MISFENLMIPANGRQMHQEKPASKSYHFQPKVEEKRIFSQNLNEKHNLTLELRFVHTGEISDRTC